MKGLVAISILLIINSQAWAQDFTVTAPYTSPTRTTCGATNDCGLETSEDHEYQVNIPTTGTWTISLCGSSYDTRLYVGSVICLGDIGYNDDDCGTQSELVLALTAGTHYVTVEGWLGNCGDYVLDISMATPPPAEDDCTGALPIACGDVVTGNTSNYTADTQATCGTTDGTGGGLWYTIAGTGNPITASLCGSTFDTKLRVYSGSCAGLTCVDGNDDDCGTQSEVTFASTLGVDYYILVHGFGGSEGDYTLTISCLSPPGPEDLCSGAIPIACGDVETGNTTGYGVDNEAACTATDGTGGGLWYEFTGTGDMVTASLCGSAFDTQIRVYSGSCAALTCVSGNDNSCGTQSETSFISTVGVSYYILVHGWAANEGSYTLSITCSTPAGPEDFCLGAIPISCGDIETGNTSGYTADTTPFCGTGDGTGGGLWYEFTGTGDYVTASLCGSGFDTRIRVFTGTCASLVCQIGNDDFCGTQSEVTFPSLAGTTYYILVHGFGSSTGAYTLALTCGPPPVPTGEDCAGGLTVCSTDTYTGNSNGDGNVTDLSSSNQGCLASEENQSSWYFFQAATAGDIAFEIVTAVDYDFAVWGPFTDPICPPIGDPLRCSYSAQAGNTGLLATSTDQTEGAGGDAYVEPITAAAGDVFILVIDNFTSDFTSFDLNWTLSGGSTLDCTPLPIELLSFTGETENGQNRLYWTTATETNNHYFNIERSDDGIRYEVIATIPGAGNSSSILNYESLDEQPFQGLNYYRLKQTDFDGKYSYSNPISVYTLESGRPYLHLYPNPVDDILTIQTNLRDDPDCVITVRNTMGMALPELASPHGIQELDVSRLVSGIYTVEIRSYDRVITSHFLKQ